MISSKWLALVAASLFLSSCGDLATLISGRDRNDRSSRPLPKLLESAVLEIHESTYHEACDDKYKALQLEVARTLDARINEIETQLKTPTEDGNYRLVQAGPLEIFEQISVDEASDEWLRYDMTWEEIAKIWPTVKDSAMSDQWLRINSYVRSLLTDDRKRVLHGVNVYIARSDIPGLLALQGEVDVCFAEPTCSLPELSEVPLNLATSNPYFNYYYRRLADGSEGREALESWKRAVDLDVADVAFVKNPGISLNADGILLVPLNPGPLQGSESLLENYIESFWASEGIKVDILWTNEDSAFSFVVDEDIGGRAFVRYKDKTIHLSDGVRDRTIIHEFGHVLGLPDEYYTTWNADSCIYSYEYNPANIMSDSAAGLAQEAHWQSLREQYGN